MKVLVVGAGGRTGRAVVEAAVREGHDVTAFVHTAGRDDVPGARMCAGDASDAAAIDAAVEGQDAVIDTVGGKTPYRRSTLEASVATSIVAAMQRHGVRRLIVTSSLGVGDSSVQAPPLVRLVVATYLRGSTADKTAMESIVRGSGLDVVITRPAVLSDAAATGRIRVLAPGSGEKARSVTRSGLAAFLVAQLTSDDHLGQAVTLADR